MRRSFTWMLRAAAVAGLGILTWYGAALLLPFPEEKLHQAPQGMRLLDAQGNPLRRVLSREGLDCDWLPLSELGEWTGRALIAVEDQRFYQHPGVDPIAVLRAGGQNLLAGRVVSGASTLSTQVIRLMEPRPRTLWTKVVEAFQATQLELRHDKDFILEQYLNRAPFGGNRQGLAAAARAYFGKEPADLSAGEAALLAGLPQSPSRLRPDRSPERAQRRRETVLRRMREEGLIERDPLLEEGRRAVPPPFRAPHFCDWVLARHPGLRGDIPTTLDPFVQSRLERAAADFRASPRHADIDGIGLLLLDARTGAVLGMVGGFDPFHPAHGALNTTLRRRSPGSTLKPFLFALAMQRGWLRPDTELDDSPRAYRDYHPRNMDRRNAGTVRAADALVRSLNLPTLEVTERLGISSSLDFLRACGLPLPGADPEKTGLGFALGGGVETSLLELCSAYTLFANGGWRSSPTGLPGKGGQTQPLVAPGVAYWISRILSSPERMSALYGHRAEVDLPVFAFKTGTSHGLRDAWAIGWNGERVLGIWMGRMDGASVPGLAGLSHAAPLLATLAPELLPACDPDWPRPTPDIIDWQGREMIAGISDPEPPRPALRPRILSPIPDLTLRVTEADGAWISLQADSAGTGPVHWFANGTYLGLQPQGRPLAHRLPVGDHVLRAVFGDGSAEIRRVSIAGM